jgi:RNA-binding protein YlmH
MRRVVILGLMGLGVLAMGGNIEDIKAKILQKDQEALGFIQKHMECVKKATSKAEIKRCNFVIGKEKKIWKLKRQIEKIKAKTGAPSVPKLEQQLKCIQQAQTSKDLKKCK